MFNSNLINSSKSVIHIVSRGMAISSVFALPKRKNSVETHRTVLSSMGLMKQIKSTLPRKDESRLSGNQKWPCSRVSCPMSFD